MTTNAFNAEQASALLRTKGFTVKPHGARYLLAAPGTVASPVTSEDLIAFAEQAAGGEAAPGWTAICGSCVQSFIADSPVQDGAICPACHPVATPPAQDIETQLRAHGWTWSQEKSRGDDGYRFHNTKTFEVCWYPSLQRRLDADRSAPELYERIAAGWTPPPLDGGTFTRPPDVAEYTAIPLAHIDQGRYQPRTTFDQAELEDLAASIREHGVIDPIVVFVNERGRYELIAGERRKRAASIVGLIEVPARIIEADLQIIHELSLFENIQRANLSAIEEGKGFNRIITELNISEAELARRLGKNRAYIQQRRAIAGAAPEVVAALDAGAITFSQARAIAAAAPGDEKAQKAAVLKMAELTKQGKRTTEAEARQAAEKVVLAKAKAKLEELGWAIDQAYAYTLIWARCERPRQWTGAEVIEAVNANRAPAGVPPSADPNAVTSEQILVLEYRHKVDQSHKPWIGLYQNWNELPIFYAPAEIAPIVAQIQAEFDALAARYQAHGWTLRYQGHSFDAKSSKGARLYLHDWKIVEEQIGLIEAGTISDEPEKASTAPTLQKCADCKKDVRSLTYFENRRICDGCEATAKQSVVERQKRIATEIAAVAGPWLASAPLDALRTLVAGLNHAYDPGQRAKVAASIRQMDAASLNVTILEWLGKRADDYHFCPVWQLPGSCPVVEPAPTAAALSPETSISDRMIALCDAQDWTAAQALIDGLPSGAVGARRDLATILDRARQAPIAPADLAPTSPLDELRTALAAIQSTTEIDGWTPEELRVNLAELAEIRRRLEALADAPDVSDADYDAVMHTIRELEDQVTDLLPVESEASA